MKRLGEALEWFLRAVTGTLLMCTVGYLLAGRETISVNTLWQILLSSLFTTAVTLLLVPGEEKKRYILYLKCFLHYLALCVVMFFCGNWFGWCDFSFNGFAAMAVDVAIVYVFVFLTSYIMNKGLADEINRQLKEKDREE